MRIDFQFSDDGRRVRCIRDAARDGRDDGVERADGAWWYLAVGDAAPVPLRRARPGETRREVWESALRYLDAAV